MKRECIFIAYILLLIFLDQMKLGCGPVWLKLQTSQDPIHFNCVP